MKEVLKKDYFIVKGFFGLSSNKLICLRDALDI